MDGLMDVWMCDSGSHALGYECKKLALARVILQYSVK